MTTPALPPGFVLDDEQDVPPLPPGFVMESAQQPQMAAPQQSADPTGNFVQNLAAGAGSAFVETGAGLAQAGRGALDYFYSQNPSVGSEGGRQGNREAMAQSRTDTDERRRLNGPLMDTWGGNVGNIGTQIGLMAVPVGGAGARVAGLAGKAAPYAGAAGRSGAFSATQAVGEGESRAVNAAVGTGLGIAGQGVANVGKRVASGAVSRLTDTGQALARKAQDAGIKLGVPNLSQNPLVRTAASQMARLPFSGEAKRNAANQEAFNRKVGETFGADADRITPDVFAKAKTALQDTFERLSSRNDLSLDTKVVGELKQVSDEAARLGGNDTARMVRGWISELVDKVDEAGSVPGKAYQSFDSRLGKVIKSGGEPAVYLGRVRDAVREAMDSSISATDRAAWAKVRKQYAAMKTVEPLVAKATDGNIPPSQLMGRVTADGAGKVRAATGKAGALGDLGRIGQQYLKDAPNSGTADRLAINALVGGGLFGLQGTGVISPETALWTGAALGGNRLALKALNSKGLAMGGSKTLNGLSRLSQLAPRALPATANAQGLGVGIAGGTVATQADIDRDAEIVRQFRARQPR